MARGAAARVGAVRADNNNNNNNYSEEKARPARREVLAGLLAAGAALGFSTQQQQASAAMNNMNPVAAAKSKANQAVQGAKDVAGSNPLSGFTASNPLEGVERGVDEAATGIKKRMDGLFGKNKPYPQRNTQVTGNGAVADAKSRVNNFLNKSQNPLATNIEKATKETIATGPNSASARANRELLGQDSTRVDEATARVNAGAENLKGKAVQAFGDVKSAAQGAAPDVNLPSGPDAGNLFKGLANKIEGATSDVASKAEEAKRNLPGQ
jgi:hypothetical protein